MSDRDLRAAIVSALADRPLTAQELARLLRVRRTDVNGVLAVGGFVRAETPSGGSRRATYWTVAAAGSVRSHRVPVSHEARILGLLADGRPHSHHELYSLGTVAHSRVAVLRQRGHRIECWRDGGVYLYRLIHAGKRAAA